MFEKNTQAKFSREPGLCSCFQHDNPHDGGFLKTNRESLQAVYMDGEDGWDKLIKMAMKMPLPCPLYAVIPTQEESGQEKRDHLASFPA